MALLVPLGYLLNSFAYLVMSWLLSGAQLPSVQWISVFQPQFYSVPLTGCLIQWFWDNAWINSECFGSLNHHNVTTQMEIEKEMNSLLKQCPGAMQCKHIHSRESGWQERERRSHRYNKILLSFTRSFEVWGGKDIGSRARKTGFKPQAKEYELVGCAALKSGEKEAGGFGEPLPIP